jgi:uncharacterized protein (PEP-CTERM system associated)
MRCRLPWPLTGIAALLLAQIGITGAWAQARNQSYGAAIDTRLSYSVNSRLGGRDAGEWLGEVTPSISLSSRSGRVVGSLEYGLTIVERSRNEPSSETVNRLSANFSAEAVPRHLSIDGSASISQQSRSPFGLQLANTSVVDNPNRVEVGTASISPALRGVLAGSISAEARLNLSTVNTRRSLVGDNTQTGGSLSLSSTVPGTLVSWGLSARTTETDFRVGRSTRGDNVTATLGWQADADLSLSARGGSESQNVQDLDTQRTSTWGVGATWRPSPRTRLQANLDDRYFGRGYSIVADYRMPRSSLSWSSNRDSSNNFSNVAPVTQFQLLMALLAAEFPDPTVREAVVRERLAGADPSTVVIPGFVNQAVSVAERHQLSAVWSGLRLSAGAQAYRSTTTVIDAAASAVAREPVRLNGYSANVSYRLTPTSSISASGSRQMTKATSAQAANDLKSATLSYSEQLGRRTNASLSARYSVFNSIATPYREAAVTASLSMRF